jgi:hypothetical protein
METSSVGNRDERVRRYVPLPYTNRSGIMIEWISKHTVLRHMEEGQACSLRTDMPSAESCFGYNLEEVIFPALLVHDMKWCSGFQRYTCEVFAWSLSIRIAQEFAYLRTFTRTATRGYVSFTYLRYTRRTLDQSCHIKHSLKSSLVLFVVLSTYSQIQMLSK